MSITLYQRPLKPINEWWDKPLGEFVPVSRSSFIIRVLKALDHRTPVRPAPDQRRRFSFFTLTPYYTDIGMLVGWKVSLRRRASRALFGSCLYFPPPANHRAHRGPRRVRRLLQLNGLMLTTYTDGAVLLYYRGRFKEPRFKRDALYA